MHSNQITASHLKIFKKGTKIGTGFYFNEDLQFQFTIILRVGGYDHETPQKGFIIINSENHHT